MKLDTWYGAASFGAMTGAATAGKYLSYPLRMLGFDFSAQDQALEDAWYSQLGANDQTTRPITELGAKAYATATIARAGIGFGGTAPGGFMGAQIARFANAYPTAYGLSQAAGLSAGSYTTGRGFAEGLGLLADKNSTIGQKIEGGGNALLNWAAFAGMMNAANQISPPEKRGFRSQPKATPCEGVAPNSELQAARQRIAGQIEEVARRRSLGTDPASGRYRVLEEQAALRLEQRVGTLRRDPSGTGDWLDVAGRSYDAVGPVPVNHIDTASFVNQINRHLNKQGLDKVVIDLTGFDSAQRRVIFDHLRSLDPSQLQRIHIQRTR